MSAMAVIVATMSLAPPALWGQEGPSSRAASTPAAKPSEEPAALTPLDLKVDPTLTCIGILWNVKGDSNANATGTVVFRQADRTEWNKAFDLRRVPPRTSTGTARPSGRRGRGSPSGQDRGSVGVNYLAGSIFYLQPGAKYEVKITLADPDGGGTSSTVTVTTRAVPAIPKVGNVIEVKGGGDALKKALETAKAGDIFNVHAGKYQGGCVVSAEGTADKPICIRSAGDGEVLLHGGDEPKAKLNGIHVKVPNVRIEGLSFYNFHHCILGDPSATDLAVMRCKMNHFFNAFFVAGARGYYADNSIRESYNALDLSVAPGMRNEGSGIWVTRGGDGSVICNNEISLVADGVRTYCGGCDVYGNDVIFNVDDGIELDNGGPNLRVMDNRWSFTGQNGISFQPYAGGPAFLIRNLVIGPKENAIKNRYESDGAVLINNTLISFATQANDILAGTYSRNNLFLELPGKGHSSAKIDVSPDLVRRLDMDYDGYGDKGPNGMPVKEFSAKTAQEKHGVQFTSNEAVLANPPGLFEQYQSKQWVVPETFLKEKGRPHPDLSLRAGSPAIGAGVAVPNISEAVNGKAPDLGALQFGQPMPHYGPR